MTQGVKHFGFERDRDRTEMKRPWLDAGRESLRCSSVKPADGKRCKNVAVAEGLCSIHHNLAKERASEDPAGWSHLRLEREVIRLRGLLAAVGHSALDATPAKRQRPGSTPLPEKPGKAKQ